MTEVWGDPSQNFEVKDFSHFELHRTERKQSCTRNSGGIIIYVRNNLISEETLFAKRDDTHIWLRLKHKLFNFNNDLFLLLCYIPPSSSSRQSLIEKNIYDSIMQDVLEIQNLTNDKCNFLLLKLHNVVSEGFECTLGVRQGSVSLLFFLLCI